MCQVKDRHSEIQIDAVTLEQLLDYRSLVKALAQGLKQKIQVPPRQHHDYNQTRARSCTLLMMPAWIPEQYLGLKVVTVTPGNQAQNLPTIQGHYLLYAATNGRPLASIDAPTLTNLRTAAASALASSHLSREDSETLLILGTGSLAPFLVRAHASVRPIRRVLVWGRDPAKAEALVGTLGDQWHVEACPSIQEAMQIADIVTAATMSPRPLVLGREVRPGQHIDLVGAYRPDMREGDDDLIKKAKVYVDTLDGIWESGDIAQPLHAGLITKEDIQGTLISLSRGQREGRGSPDEVTVFKSVGHASEDLIAAILAYERASTA